MSKTGERASDNVYSRLRQYKTIFDEEMEVKRLGKKDFTLINRIIANVSAEPWKIISKYEYRPDNISNFHYGTPYLYWIIMGYNKLFHFKDLYVNRTIMIPDYNSVIGILI
jgi:hypothetical protein